MNNPIDKLSLQNQLNKAQEFVDAWRTLYYGGYLSEAEAERIKRRINKQFNLWVEKPPST